MNQFKIFYESESSRGGNAEQEPVEKLAKATREQYSNILPQKLTKGADKIEQWHLVTWENHGYTLFTTAPRVENQSDYKVYVIIKDGKRDYFWEPYPNITGQNPVQIPDQDIDNLVLINPGLKNNGQIFEGWNNGRSLSDLYIYIKI